MPPDDSLNTKDMIIIAVLIVVTVVAFWAVASVVGKAKPIFDAPPVSASP